MWGLMKGEGMLLLTSDVELAADAEEEGKQELKDGVEVG